MQKNSEKQQSTRAEKQRQTQCLSLNRELLNGLHWLPKELWRSSSLYPSPSTEITDTSAQKTFVWALGIWNQIHMLLWQAHRTHRMILPRLMPGAEWGSHGPVSERLLPPPLPCKFPKVSNSDSFSFFAAVCVHRVLGRRLWLLKVVSLWRARPVLGAAKESPSHLLLSLGSQVSQLPLCPKRQPLFSYYQETVEFQERDDPIFKRLEIVCMTFLS